MLTARETATAVEMFRRVARHTLNVGDRTMLCTDIVAPPWDEHR